MVQLEAPLVKPLVAWASFEWPGRRTHAVCSLPLPTLRELPHRCRTGARAFEWLGGGGWGRLWWCGWANEQTLDMGLRRGGEKGGVVR